MRLFLYLNFISCAIVLYLLSRGSGYELLFYSEKIGNDVIHYTPPFYAQFHVVMFGPMQC